MKTDRELLELAAKADGINLDPIGNEIGCSSFDGDGLCKYSAGGFTTWRWRPLTDDGDALRLAVKLGMNVEVNLDDECTRILDEFSRVMLRQMHVDGDAGAATRRAIVRAAAAIGENMK